MYGVCGVECAEWSTVAVESSVEWMEIRYRMAGDRAVEFGELGLEQMRCSEVLLNEQGISRQRVNVQVHTAIP